MQGSDARSDELQAFELVGLKLRFEGDPPGDAEKRRVHAGDLCVVHYCGRIGGPDGSIFDQAPRESPLQVVAGRGKVIAAWDVAFLHMFIGQRTLLEAPPSLAYGRKGVPPKIPPNSTLYFELTVIEVINSPNENLLDAAMQGDRFQLDKALRAGADINFANRKGETALHAATMAMASDCVVLLLELQALPDIPSKTGVTPLMLATRAGDRPSAGMLLLAGASPHRASDKGTTASKLAVESKDSAMIALLESGLPTADNDKLALSDLGFGEETIIGDHRPP